MRITVVFIRWFIAVIWIRLDNCHLLYAKRVKFFFVLHLLSTRLSFLSRKKCRDFIVITSSINKMEMEKENQVKMIFNLNIFPSTCYHFCNRPSAGSPCFVEMAVGWLELGLSKAFLCPWCAADRKGTGGKREKSSKSIKNLSHSAQRHIF